MDITSTLSEEKIAERKERFRYTNLEHPLMKLLFELEIPEPQIEGLN
jgi:hypothetical protein